MTDSERSQIIHQIIHTTPTGRGSIAMVNALGLPTEALIKMFADVLWAIEEAGFEIKPKRRH
jgi:hypothetical protein